MNWYYAKGKERLGPLDESQFEQLLKTGEITASTLVWNETLSGWKRLAEIRPESVNTGPEEPVPSLPADAAPEQNRESCSQCGRQLPPSELLRFEGLNVCASCKPAFVQKIREGISVGELVYAGFWIRFVAKFVDGIVLGIVNMIIGFLVISTSVDPQTAITGTIASMFLQICTAAGYSSFFLGRFSATPGKMVFGLKVITSDNGQVSYMKGFGRYFAEVVSAMILCIGYIMAAWDPEKRALHDRICDTRVVRK